MNESDDISFHEEVVEESDFSPSVERIFSQAGQCLGGNRQCLDNQNLECGLMLRVNRNFLR